MKRLLGSLIFLCVFLCLSSCQKSDKELSSGVSCAESAGVSQISSEVQDLEESSSNAATSFLESSHVSSALMSSQRASSKMTVSAKTSSAAISSKKSSSSESSSKSEVPAKPAPGSSSDDASDIAELAAERQQMLGRINTERANNGVSPLRLHTKLSHAAQIRAKEIVQKFAHIRPDGSSCFTVLPEAGIVFYRAAGENIAAGQRTVTEVMDAWMNSSGHRANILNEGFDSVGIGHVSQGGKQYWVQMFGAELK